MDELLKKIPSPAKDAKITFERALAGEGLSPVDARLIAYAIFVSLKCQETAGVLTVDHSPESLAAALMRMPNVYCSFTDTVGDTALSAEAPSMRMQGYANHGGVDKKLFETLTLAVSIVGKCKPCIKAHIEELKKLGLSAKDFKEIGKIAASAASVSRWLN